jgi:hypothetical protein
VQYRFRAVGHNITYLVGACHIFEGRVRSRPRRTIKRANDETPTRPDPRGARETGREKGPREHILGRHLLPPGFGNEPACPISEPRKRFRRILGSFLVRKPAGTFPGAAFPPSRGIFLVFWNFTGKVGYCSQEKRLVPGKVSFLSTPCCGTFHRQKGRAYLMRGVRASLAEAGESLRPH